MTRCDALRAEITSNIQAQAAEAAAGHATEVDLLRRKIAASLDRARAVPGCNVADLKNR